MSRIVLPKNALIAAAVLLTSLTSGAALGSGNDIAEVQGPMLTSGTTLGANSDFPAEFQGTWGYVSQDQESCKASDFSKADHVFKIEPQRIQELEHACEVLEVTVPLKDENIDTQKRMDVRLRCAGEGATWEGSGSLVLQDAPNGQLLVAAMSEGRSSEDQTVGYKASSLPASISIARRCQK